MTLKYVEMTRSELYEKVWSVPMSRLAKQFGMSDVGLAKICKKLGIPRPGLGYWRRANLGYKVRRTPLPLTPRGAPEKATIRVRERTGDLLELSDEARDLIAAESLPENKIVVADSLRGAHDLVKLTNAYYRGRHPEGYEQRAAAYNNSLNVRVSGGTLRRGLLIWDALIKALASRGMEVSVRGNRERLTAVTVLGDQVELSMHETSSRTERPLTKEEQRENTEGKLLYLSNRYEYHPTGRLALQIDTIYLVPDGLHRTWSDTKHQRLEDRLNAFVVGLITLADLRRKERRRREEEDRFQAEERRRRYEEEERRRRERERVKRLFRQAVAWEKGRRIRVFVEAVQVVANSRGWSSFDGQDLKAWIEWANLQADLVDPAGGINAPELTGGPGTDLGNQ